MDKVVLREVPGVRHPDPYGNPVLHAEGGSVRFSYDVCVRDGRGRAHIDFDTVFGLSFGWPNDEVLSGHRLHEFGLRPYLVQEVLPSDWIAEMEIGNRVHPRHSARLFNGLRHLIIPLKDETFECVFSELQINYEPGDRI